MRRRPIGQILVEQGEISESDLEAALAEQERSGRRLGEILIEQGRTSWLALARAIAEQVLDIQNSPAVPEADPEPEPEAVPDPVKMVRELAERVASLPPVPDPLPPPGPDPAEQELARAVAQQVANLDTPVPPSPQVQPQPQQEAQVLQLTPSSQHGLPVMSTDEKLLSIEALLRERQRAFIEMVTMAETLRMKVARLEEILEERDRELAKLRIARAV
jgi:hypothetical protein